MSDADEEAQQAWRTRFQELVSSNLDLPGALALTWELVRADLQSHAKLDLVREFDGVLGLGLAAVSGGYAVPEDVQEILEERDALRHDAREAAVLDTRQAAKTVRRSYEEADTLRDTLMESGYVVEDAPTGTRVRPMYEWEWYEESSQAVSDPWEAGSWLVEPDRVDFSIVVVARNYYIDDVSRCVQSALRWAGDRSVELIAIDNGSTDGTGEWLAETASKDPRIRVTHLDHPVGDGASKNLGLNQSAGRTILLLDPSVEVQGDLLRPIADLLSEETVGAVGAFGLRSTDLQQFDGVQEQSGDADSIRGVCFAFRRALVPQVGMMRESFRYHEALDLDYSLQIKAMGYRLFADPTLPAMGHELRVWTDLEDGDRSRLSRRNRYRFATA